MVFKPNYFFGFWVTNGPPFPSRDLPFVHLVGDETRNPNLQEETSVTKEQTTQGLCRENKGRHPKVSEL